MPVEIYETFVSKAGVNAANTVMWMLKSNASQPLYVREIGISISVAPSTAPNWALALATGLGTSSTTVLGQKLKQQSPAATGTFDSAWSGAPTFTTAGPFYKGMGMPVTAGSGVIWVYGYGEELELAVSSGLCICNLAASGATTGTMGCYVKWSE